MDRQIAIIEPKLIATLGRHSMNKFFPGGKITRIHGVKGVKREGARVYLPLFHPAYVLRNMNAAGDAVADIRLIPRLIKRLEQRLAEEAAFSFDLPVIDGAVNGAGRLVRTVASRARAMQPGLVRSYGVLFAAGTVAVLAWLVLRGA